MHVRPQHRTRLGTGATGIPARPHQLAERERGRRIELAPAIQAIA
jgi:hypothetical protein